MDTKFGSKNVEEGREKVRMERGKYEKWMMSKKVMSLKHSWPMNIKYVKITPKNSYWWSTELSLFFLSSSSFSLLLSLLLLLTWIRSALNYMLKQTIYFFLRQLMNDDHKSKLFLSLIFFSPSFPSLPSLFFLFFHPLPPLVLLFLSLTKVTEYYT